MLRAREHSLLLAGAQKFKGKGHRAQGNNIENDARKDADG